MAKLLSERAFANKLNSMVKAAETTAELCRELSNDSIRHFEEHKDTTKLKRLHDAMLKNFLRRTALVAWAQTFSPLKIEGERWFLDKSREAVNFNTKAAMAVPFWDFKPEPENTALTVELIFQLVEKLTKKLDKSEPADDRAERARDVVGAAFEQAKRGFYTSNVEALPNQGVTLN